VEVDGYALICGGRIHTLTYRQARRAGGEVGGWMDGWGVPMLFYAVPTYLVDDFWLSNPIHPTPCVCVCVDVLLCTRVWSAAALPACLPACLPAVSHPPDLPTNPASTQSGVQT